MDICSIKNLISKAEIRNVLNSQCMQKEKLDE